jgi:hypothetical protein
MMFGQILCLIESLLFLVGMHLRIEANEMMYQPVHVILQVYAAPVPHEIHHTRQPAYGSLVTFDVCSLTCAVLLITELVLRTPSYPVACPQQ